MYSIMNKRKFQKHLTLKNNMNLFFIINILMILQQDYHHLLRILRKMIIIQWPNNVKLLKKL